jgi:Family of unknown function (DUF5763)
MEKQILELIEEEVCRRTQLKLANVLTNVSRLYEIPMERLVKDTAGFEPKFCKGILRNGQRCLKKPFENGYCKFHRKQAPEHPAQSPPQPPTEAPWD